MAYSVTDVGLATIDGAASGYLSNDNSTVILSDADISDTHVRLTMGVKRAAVVPEIGLSYGIGLD